MYSKDGSKGCPSLASANAFLHSHNADSARPSRTVPACALSGAAVVSSRQFRNEAFIHDTTCPSPFFGRDLCR